MRPVPPTGHWHEDYERGRPGWPAAVAHVAEVPSAATVLELGAGTGKLTRVLLPRFDRVVAVEPDEAMRRLLDALCPEACALAGSAEAIPVADVSVDAVFAAEALPLVRRGARARRDRACAQAARRIDAHVERARRPDGAVYRPGGGAPDRACAVQGGARPRPARPQRESVLLRRVAGAVRRVGVRRAAGGSAREHAGPRPRRTGGVLRLDGLAGRSPRAGAAAARRSGAVASRCGRVSAPMGDARLLDAAPRGAALRRSSPWTAAGVRASTGVKRGVPPRRLAARSARSARSPSSEEPPDEAGSLGEDDAHDAGQQEIEREEYGSAHSSEIPAPSPSRMPS
jgi:SAM-dependent methyltransferase